MNSGKKTSRISIFEANSSSLGLAPEANTFDKKCLREKMLLFWKKDVNKWIRKC